MLQREAALRAEARSLVERGELRAAEALYLQCEEIGRDLGDAEVRDLAICNRASVKVSLGCGDELVVALRAILLATRSETNAFLAAYTVSRHYEYKKEYKKSLFYGRIALDKVERADNSGWRAGTLNQIGNALLATSEVNAAQRHYRQALALVAEGSVLQGIFLYNLGYCEVLEGRALDGARKLMRALRITRRNGARIEEVQARTDLSFAYLELGRCERAGRHAERALSLARELDWQHGVKNALYVAGESARLAGDLEIAESRFEELQHDFYPEQPYLGTLLMAVDVRRMINLHA